MENFKQGWRQFLHWCQRAENDKRLDGLFELILTAEERDNIAMRCLIVKELLAQKRSQRDIAAYLDVSIAKITRGSNEIKRTKPSIIQYVESHLLND